MCFFSMSGYRWPSSWSWTKKFVNVFCCRSAALILNADEGKLIQFSLKILRQFSKIRTLTKSLCNFSVNHSIGKKCQIFLFLFSRSNFKCRWGETHSIQLKNIKTVLKNQNSLKSLCAFLADLGIDDPVVGIGQKSLSMFFCFFLATPTLNADE